MRVAIIPARGGSKRIPRKNIKNFCGRPMIEWSIEAAKASGCFARILVSTDDEEIAAVARSAGVEAPFVRPPELSGDLVATVPVIGHALRWLAGRGVAPEHACCIYATAPFLRAEDLRSGLSALITEEADFAFAVTSFEFPIQRAVRINADGRVEMFQPEFADTRSQDLEPSFHDAGQFYWGRSAAWLTGTPIFSPASVPVVLPRQRVQDIDTAEDWDRAELLFQLLGKSGAEGAQR